MTDKAHEIWVFVTVRVPCGIQRGFLSALMRGFYKSIRLFLDLKFALRNDIKWGLPSCELHRRNSLCMLMFSLASIP